MRRSATALARLLGRVARFDVRLWCLGLAGGPYRRPPRGALGAACGIARGVAAVPRRRMVRRRGRPCPPMAFQAPAGAEVGAAVVSRDNGRDVADTTVLEHGEHGPPCRAVRLAGITQ